MYGHKVNNPSKQENCILLDIGIVVNDARKEEDALTAQMNNKRKKER